MAMQARSPGLRIVISKYPMTTLCEKARFDCTAPTSWLWLALPLYVTVNLSLCTFTRWDTCGTWLIHVWDMTHSHVGHDSFMCGTWIIHVWYMSHLCVVRGGHDSLLDRINLRVRCDSFTWETWATYTHVHIHMYTCNLYIHMYVHVSVFACAIWLIHVRDMSHLHTRTHTHVHM